MTAVRVRAGVFVCDGLLYASHAFVCVRNMMLVGFFLVFCPVLGLSLSLAHSLWAIWLAKAALNAWRLVASAVYLHWEGRARPVGSCA